jgi:prepilin-type N-terminal cleavage/methylation domain-containing protein
MMVIPTAMPLCLQRFVAGQRRIAASTTGLSLVELMVAVVVIAVLSGLALPAYQKSIKKAKMAEAELAVTEVVNLQTKHFMDTASYSADLTDLGYSPTPPLKYYSIQVVPVEDVASTGVVYRVAATGTSPDLDSVILSVYTDGKTDHWQGPPQTAVSLGLVPAVVVAGGGGSTPATTPASEGSGSSGSAPTSDSSSPPSSSGAVSSSSAPSGSGGAGGGSGDSSGSGGSSPPSAPSEEPPAAAPTEPAASAPAAATASATSSSSSDADSKDKEKKDKKDKKDWKTLINWVKSWTKSKD